MYNSEITIEYSDDDEYRKAFLRAFCLPLKNEEDILKAFEGETGIDTIYEKTRDHSLFRALYEKSASTCLFSNDLETGCVVLFSYTFFDVFHSLLCDFLNTGIVEETNIHYKKLLEKLSQ
jgi:hypothetical protein